MIRAENIVNYYVGYYDFIKYVKKDKDYKNLSREEKINIRKKLLENNDSCYFIINTKNKRTVKHKDYDLIATSKFIPNKKSTTIIIYSSFFFNSLINCKYPCDDLPAVRFTYSFLLGNFFAWILESRGYKKINIVINVRKHGHIKKYSVPYIPKLVKFIYEDYRRKFKDLL